MTVGLAGGGADSGFTGLEGLSADGRFAAFQTTADNLAAGTSGLIEKVLVRDRLLGTTELVQLNLPPGTGSTLRPWVPRSRPAVASSR